MEKELEKAVTEIHAICAALPPIDAERALRFLRSRLGWKTESVAEAWRADREANAAAALAYRDMREHRLKAAAEELGVSVEALVEGVESKSGVN